MKFGHITLGQRILFGSGEAARNVKDEIARIGAKRVMCIAGGAEMDIAKSVMSLAEVALWHSDVVQHVPLEIAEKAREAAGSSNIDLIVCVGGGSTTGLAKAVALTSGIPVVAVPTTYAGSEATNVWGLTENATKTTGVDDRVLPATVIYDAALTMSLPGSLSVASGLNALAHCVDSLWAPRADPINAALASEAIKALAQGLLRIAQDPSDMAGRENTLYGAYIAAVAFASAGSGLHHKICHVLGGTFNMPHAETHATVLPYVVALNAPASADASSRLVAALRAGLSKESGDQAAHSDASEALELLIELKERLGAPSNLQEYGFKESEVEEATRRVLLAVPESNPAVATEEVVASLLTAACLGRDPRQLLEEVHA